MFYENSAVFPRGLSGSRGESFAVMPSLCCHSARLLKHEIQSSKSHKRNIQGA